jgi:acyl-homoserine lactone acylase PvdQ
VPLSCVFALVVAWCSAAGCGRSAPPPPLVAQVDGSITLAGLTAPVQVVRDRWGVPHLTAQNADDLFTAQGFVQAQDRLFQMDLWRRSAQGRLAQVLGANFVDRDAMTRRMQYRGDLDAEWASYGPDARAIAGAFVRGINAWVALARERPPEDFVRAGWKPEFWSATDLLNRTDAFLASGDALDEIAARHLNDVVADAVRSVGTAPFFAAALSNPLPESPLQPAAPGGVHADRNSVRTMEARRRYAHPSTRYLVHLQAPGWNVIGATSPWMPGVAIGHNDRVAWGMTPIAVDTQDVYEVSSDEPRRVVREAIFIKGRAEPFFFDSELTARGVIVATDRARRLAFAVRWSGFEPGGAGELAALALDRARTWAEFRAALARWRMPPRRVVFSEVDNQIAFQDVALVPVRRAGEWQRWLSIDELPHAPNPTGGPIDASAPPHRAVARSPEAIFSHVLGVDRTSRSRYDIGPLARPPGDDSAVRLELTPPEWDRSRAINAPGQSGTPASPHFADQAPLWSRGEWVPLPFTDAAVRAATETTLTLVPPSAAPVQRYP